MKLLILLGCIALSQAFDQKSEWKAAKSVFPFTANNIDGQSVSMENYKGYLTIFVNVASQCGLTERNYKQLERLYKDYKSKGLRIVAFPCNQFSGQEPGTEAEIKEFVKKYDVDFDMMSKIDVNGENAHPIYKWLKSQTSKNADISWNFEKFVVDKTGQVLKRYGPQVNPDDMENDIKEFLKL